MNDGLDRSSVERERGDEPRLFDRTVYWLLRLSMFLTRPLPLRFCYWCAEPLAMVCYWVIFPRHRKALNANLAQALQSDDPGFVSAVARRSFRNFGKYVIDVLRFPSITRDEIVGRLRFEQWDELRELREATDAKRGIIVATIHFGNWDFGTPAIASQGFVVNAIAETFAYPPMNDLMRASRSKLGTKVIERQRVGPTVFKALRRGEILALLVDVASESDGLRVEFFGAPALVSPAAARIALRTNAWVVPAVVLRGPDDDTVIRPVIDTGLRDFVPTGDETHDVRELMRLIMASLEKTIRQYPDQWFIFRRLWDDATTAPAPAHALVEGV